MFVIFQNFPQLSELFTVGQLVVCSVLGVDESVVELTLDPKVVNTSELFQLQNESTNAKFQPAAQTCKWSIFVKLSKAVWRIGL